jgi:hypothetical protein
MKAMARSAASSGKRQPDGVRERDRMALGVGRGGPDAGHRGVEADDPVTRPGQHAPEPALAAAHVDGQATRLTFVILMTN